MSIDMHNALGLMIAPGTDVWAIKKFAEVSRCPLNLVHCACSDPVITLQHILVGPIVVEETTMKLSDRNCSFYYKLATEDHLFHQNDVFLTEKQAKKELSERIS